VARKPQWYRDRAEEARTIAGSITADAAKQAMLQVAAQWDVMADEAERLAKVKMTIAALPGS
jgi:hypothetical protein